MCKYECITHNFVFIKVSFKVYGTCNSHAAILHNLSKCLTNFYLLSMVIPIISDHAALLVYKDKLEVLEICLIEFVVSFVKALFE